MILIPKKLVPYIDFEEGKIISKDLPSDLEEDFKELKKLYEARKKDELTDY